MAEIIIHAVNIKTRRPQQFTQKQWDEAGKKGFQSKFEIVDKREALSPAEQTSFEPDAIAEKVKGIVEGTGTTKAADPNTTV